MASDKNWDIAANTTLYANWAANIYTVTFDKQSGTGGIDSVSATYGTAMPVATAPTRAGYSFGGYYTGTNGMGNQYYTAAMASARNWDIAANTTLYANWTGSAYTVTFDKQSGTGGSDSVSATYGVAMPVASAPTRTGYTFGGYYTVTNGTGTQYYTAAMASARNWDIAAKTTLYANWAANIYIVTFDKQSGTGGSDSVSATYGAAMPAATAPTRAGYSFGGYYTGTNGMGNQYYTAAMASVRNCDIAANTALYANWIITVIGTGAPPPRSGASSSTTTNTNPPVTLPNIYVQIASLSDVAVEPDVPVTVTAAVSNKGTVNGNKKVTVYVNGQAETTQSITVNSGDSLQLTFNISRSTPGEYTVYVDGVPAGSYKVELFRKSDLVLIFSITMLLMAFVVGMVILRRRQQGYY
jgi:hypothetical protein